MKRKPVQVQDDEKDKEEEKLLLRTRSEYSRNFRSADEIPC